MQPLAGSHGKTKRTAERANHHQYPQCHQYQLVQTAQQAAGTRKMPSAARQEVIALWLGEITDKRKGIDYLVEACKILASQDPGLSKQLGVVVFGKQAEQYASLFPFPIYPMNYVSNEKELVDIYNAVDLYVTPSLQDNLPNTIVEAMACGIPCVGFHVGGIPQMIDHLHNGYVAEYQSAKDLANGIRWTLTEGEYDSLSEEACRKALSSYSESTISMRYIDIYNKITGSHA